MITTIFNIADNILFFCICLPSIYMFIFAVAALFRRSVRYPKADTQHPVILFIPLGTEICKQNYPEDLYTVQPYEDLALTVKDIDETKYDLAVVLGETTRVSQNLIQEINDAYDTGALAMQLHHIIEPRATKKLFWKSVNEEIKNSIFRQGHTQAGVSSAFEKQDIAIDFKWLKKNLKTSKSNLESRLLRQNIFIEYLNYIHIYSNTPRPLPRPMSKLKAIFKLPETMIDGNWDYADKLFRQLLPTWKVLLMTTGIWCLFVTFYDLAYSITWWFILFCLLLTMCLAIPDYLIEKKKSKSKHI